MHVSYDGESVERMSVYNKERLSKREIRREERIVGGSATNIQRHPFYASLYLSGHDSHVCGGSLLNKDWVLTARVGICFGVAGVYWIRVELSRAELRSAKLSWAYFSWADLSWAERILAK